MIFLIVRLVKDNLGLDERTLKNGWPNLKVDEKGTRRKTNGKKDGQEVGSNRKWKMPTSYAKFFSLFLKDRSLFTSFTWQSHSNLGKNSSQRKALGKVAATLRLMWYGGFLLTLEFCRCDQSLELKPTFLSSIHHANSNRLKIIRLIAVFIDQLEEWFLLSLQDHRRGLTFLQGGILQ